MSRRPGRVSSEPPRRELVTHTTMNDFRDSNEYETEFDKHTGERLNQSPLDDRDEPSPDFTVNDELAYNLDVEHPQN